MEGVVKMRGLWTWPSLGCVVVLLAFLPLCGLAQVTTTTVQGTVYQANGSPASGTLIISWPAFTTATNQAIAAGSTSVQIGADGFVSVALAPNQNAYPSGTYYTAVYHLNGGTVNSEYWVVPAAASASIGSVRAQIEPAAVAVQTVSKSYLDSSITALSGNFLSVTGGTMNGPLTLSGDPSAENQAATKHYVDDMAATDVPLAGGNMLGTLQTPEIIAKGPRVNVLDSDFGLGQPVKAITVTNGSCTSNPTISIPPPQYSADGSQATAKGLCINGQVFAYITFPGGGYTAAQVPTITGGGTSGSTGSLVLVGVQERADPSGANDSSSAILNAADYIQGEGQTTHNLPQLYIPQGNYKLIDTVRLPCDIPVRGDGVNATVLEPVTNNENGITIYNAAEQVDEWSCDGSIANLTVYTPNNESYTADEIENLNSVGYSYNRIRIAGGGGRGLNNLYDNERNSGRDIEIDTVRWPLIWDGNENHLWKLNIATPGETPDGYCFGTGYGYVSNCVNGVYPNPGWINGTLVSASANGSTATFYVKATSIANVGGGFPALTQSTSPLVVGHHFTVAGTSGTVLDGLYTVTNVINNVASDPSGNCTAASECFEVQGASTANGTANVAAATWTPTIFPDRNAAVHVMGADDVLEGGSIKALWYAGAFNAEGMYGGRISNFYTEGFPLNGQPHEDSTLTAGGLPPQTTLTGSLSGSAGPYTVVPVASTAWFPFYINDLADAIGVGVPGGQEEAWFFRITCADYSYKSTAPCANNPGVEQGQWEDVYAVMTSQGMVIAQRDLSSSTAPAGTTWPTGSNVVQSEAGSFYGTLLVASNHPEAIDAPGSGWSSSCQDGQENVCAEFIAGNIPNQVTSFTPKMPPPNYSGIRPAIDMFNNEQWGGGTEQAGAGYLKTRGYGAIISYLDPRSASVLYGASDSSALSCQFNSRSLFNVQEADGSYPGVILQDLDNGLYCNSNITPGYTKMVNAYMDPVSGTNPGSNYSFGRQFASSWCYYDTPTTTGGHSQNRFCFKGTPSLNGMGSGFEYDTWNGSAWVNGFTLAPNSSSAVNLSVTGAGNFPGGITASTINGEITVDGTTYTTLNNAWSAALSAANSTGQNQTIRLGPGQFTVMAEMTEPANGACVSLIGSAGTATSADVTTAATTLVAGAALTDAVFEAGNTAQAQGCTFKDLNILGNRDVQHGFDFQWFRGLLIENVAVNDTTAEGILLGEESTTNGHQSNFVMRNVTVSYNSADFTPASRPAYGIHLQKTAIDSYMSDILVRNALTASVYNEGTGNTGYMIHGFGYPYTCTTAPCANNASSSSAANASYATNYVIYDTGGAGSVWTDTYIDSPAIAGFYVGANGVEIDGGHIQWPDLTSFPSANLAYVASNVTNNLLIADVSCLGMSSTANWITYANSSGNPPTFSSVHHLTGCGNYYQALEPAVTTGFSSGGANINDPSGTVPRVWATPLSAAANEAAYAVQMYTGYQGDAYQAHYSGVSPFFNVTYQGTIRSNGGLALSTVINTASTLTLTTANRNVIANASSGAQTLTLPSCYTPMPDRMAPTGLQLTITKSDSSANAVTLQTVSSQTIDYLGSTAQTLTISSPGTRNLICGPDYNWYAY